MAYTPQVWTNGVTPISDTRLNVMEAGIASAAADASTTAKGIVRLAGDLAGTSASPTVPALSGKQDLTAKGVANGYAGLDNTGKVPTGQLPTFTPSVVGLGNVDNTSDANKPVSTAQATAIALKANLASPTFTGTPALPTGTTGVTQTAGDNTTKVATTGFVAAAAAFKANIASPTFTGTVTIPTGASITAPTGLVKADVGLGSVDNTADTAKPVSTAQQTALNLKADLASPILTGTVQVPTPATGPAATNKTYVDAQDAASIVTANAYTDSQIAGVGGGGGSTTSTKKTASFTLGLSEANKIVECESSATIAVTVPPKSSVAWADDTLIELNGTGTGTVSVVAGAGVTIRTPPSPSGLTLRGQWSSASLRFRKSTAASLDTTNLVARWNADSLAGADNSAVTTWTDTVAALVASETVDTTKQPKLRTGANGLNGHNVVQFDGTSDRLTLAGGGLALAQNKSTLAVFIAYQLPVSAVTGVRTAFGLSTGTNLAQGRLSLSSHGAGGFPQVGIRRLDADAALATAQGSVALTTNHAGILTGIYHWNVQDIFVYSDGTVQASNLTAQTAGATSNTASLGGAIGASGSTSTELFSGSIAEILIFSDADATKMANVHTYLANQYGLTTSDFTGTPNEWVFSGDTVV